jgi:hypothetical protein
LEVGIHEHDDFADGLGEATRERCRFAVGACEENRTHPGVLESRENLCGTIRGSIIHDHEFPVMTRIVETLADSFDEELE